VLAQLGPKLIGVDLAAACADYERQMGARGTGLDPGAFSAYRSIELRAYRVDTGSSLVGPEARQLFPGLRVFIERVRRGDELIDAHADTVLCAGDVIAVSGPRQTLLGEVELHADEVHDVELLNLPATVVDVFVTNAAFSGKTLRELAEEPFARGVYLRKITRQGLEMPILPESEVFRGDILTLAGGVRHVNAAIEALGVADRPLESTDLMTVAGGILLGGLVGALSVNWRGVPIGLSTSGGVLVAGLLLGYLRTLRPTFGRIPAPALVLMNSLGLNAFIAIVGINAGPGFVTGVQQVGLTLFLWGAVATTLPLLFAVLLGHHVFKFHPAILFGACAGVRTTTAALGMIQDAAKSKVPALGYGMPYAIGNTLLTIFGMAIVLLTSR
jgi:putative transport protein